MQRSRLTTIMKSLSWRFVATITTVVLVFIATGELTLAFSVGLAEFLLKMMIFYTHDRVWEKITFFDRVRIQFKK